MERGKEREGRRERGRRDRQRDTETGRRDRKIFSPTTDIETERDRD